MSPDESHRASGSHADDDEVEILEVVGLDEDAVAPAAAEREDVPQEFVLSLEEAEPSPSEAVPSEEPPDRGAEVADSEQLLRLRADYENLRRRIDRERRDYEEASNAALVGRLLPVLDNFERALAAESTQSPEAFKKGVALIYKHLLHELEREGLEAIEAIGRPFDPNLHDAVATEPGAGPRTHAVTEELQRGYLFRSRLLRPALVTVRVDGTAHPPANDGTGEGEGGR